MVAQNTIAAQAASVSKRAVGGSTPGINDDQLATRMKMKIVPIRARYGPGSTCIVLRIWSSIAPTKSSNTVCFFDGTADNRHVTAIAKPTRAAMMTQVMITASVTATGPT